MTATTAAKSPARTASTSSNASRSAGQKGGSDAARRAEIRGRELLRKGQASAAQEQFSRATRAAPGNQLYWLLLAQCDNRLGQTGSAIQHLRHAFRLNQGDAQVCQLLADCLIDSHRNAEALSVLEDLSPEVTRSGQWHLAKAKAHLALLDFDGTVRECSAALTKSAGDPVLKKQALQGMGHGLMKFGGHAEAAWCYRMLLDDNPLDFGAALCAAHASSWACDWPGLATDFERLRLCIEKVEESGKRPSTGRSPFPLITLTDDPSLLRWAASLTYQEHCAGMQPVKQRPARRVPRPNGKLRLGLLSSDFHVHATSILIAEFLEGLDPDRFELYCYSGGPDDHSDLRARVRRTATCWVETADLSSAQLAARITEDQIGVLVEMKGYTMGARMDVVAYRPAPIQVSWLGYPGTTGAPSLDYVIGDPVVTPLDAQPHFTECIAQMPHCYQPNDSTRLRAVAGTRQQCGLPEDATFVFASFNMAYKIVPEVFAGLVSHPAGDTRLGAVAAGPAGHRPQAAPGGGASARTRPGPADLCALSAGGQAPFAPAAGGPVPGHLPLRRAHHRERCAVGGGARAGADGRELRVPRGGQPAAHAGTGRTGLRRHRSVHDRSDRLGSKPGGVP